jgi:adenine-specific DNA methylase
VDDVFIHTFKSALATSRPGDENHVVLHQPVEDTTTEALERLGVRTVYADPPYTAQQYSRFYHVLDVLLAGQPPTLQLVQGEVTRGLYPAARYLSPYCSKRSATQALDELTTKCARVGAALVVSYSATTSGATGNARTMSLDDVVSTLSKHFGRDSVAVEKLNIRYRQFNRADASIRDRDDPEYLIIGGESAS